MIDPLNKYLVVRPLAREEESLTMVLIPEGVEVNTSAFCLVELLEASPGSTLKRGMKLVASTHMLERAEIAGNTYYLLLENYVVGSLRGQEEH